LESSQQVRGTQTLVDQMGWVFKRPRLGLTEIAWRWIFGVPFLLVCWQQWQRILIELPPAAAGFDRVDAQNPWVALVQLGGVWNQYQPLVLATMVWLAPLAWLAWSVMSGLGRSVLLRRLEPGVRFRPLSLIVLQGASLGLLWLTFWGWWRCIHWVAATHITANGDADLVGYSIWAIFLSLGFFTLWALISWPVTMAPLLFLLEGRNPLDALAQTFRLGRAFSGKLMEINLVMGIVKLMLMVLAMVFSAAPLPFSDQLGPEALRVVSACAVVFYLVGNDYFQVVRLKSFVEFWRAYREPYAADARVP